MSEDRPLSAALLNFAYWPEVRRGNERLVHDLALGLRQRGHEPRIVTSHPGAPSRSLEEGVPVIRHWRPPQAPLRLRKFQEHLTHVPFAYAELMLGDDDVAHAFFPSDALAACRWSARTGRPAVFTFTGMPQRNNISNRRFRLRILERLIAGAAGLVVLSESAREAAWRWLGIEARVINPGVDLEAFRPGKPPETPTIVCAANPDDGRKRVELLVEAFARIRRDRAHARLLLVSPSDPGRARELSERPGIALLPRDSDISAEMFAAASVSALCSLHEAFGLVVVESLACGVPVVGARHGAIPEILDRSEVGRLFGPDDVGALADALLEALELATDPATIEACRRRAEDFSNARAVREHELLYRELLAT